MTTERHGPFETYTEVLTDRGTYGVSPGEVLILRQGEAVAFESAEGEDAESPEATTEGAPADESWTEDLPVHSDSETFNGVDSDAEDVYELEDLDDDE